MSHLSERILSSILHVSMIAVIGIVMQLPCASAEDADRPNIILIMADDMGYSDIGCYGGEILTPSLDQLAEDGVRFTQFYNNARCCPTRASLLTGLYPHQTGVGWMMTDNGHDGYRGDLNQSCMTIAEVLGESGYATYMSGKWHVTRFKDADDSQHNWPRQRGFDRFYGTIHGAGSFFDPNSLTRDDTQIVPEEDDFYYTDAISSNAVTFIDEHEGSKPFFLYVAYTAPHWPMQAREEDIERYYGRYDTGWDALRAERYARMVRMGLIDRQWEMSPRDEGIPAWPDATLKAWHRKRMEVYAAMVDRMDLGIGTIVAKLKEKEQLDNTLILFLADNGGCAEEYGSRGPVQPDAETMSMRIPMGEDELQTQMRPTFTRDGLPVRSGEGVMPGPADTYVAYGKPWANASNTPFRTYKHWVHEGGIATPLIAHWPNQIQRTNELEHQPGHIIDVMATCVDVAGAEYPQEFNGQSIHPMEGKSLVPAFQGNAIERDAIYWEHEGNRAVRVEEWKLVSKYSSGNWELYNLAEDRTELNDLAEAHPERVEEMAAKWEAYAQRTGVYPMVPYYENRLNRNQTRFELEQGEQLGRSQAPFIEGRSIEIRAELDTEQTNGVIVAQGGTAHGYSLHLDEGHLVFSTRRQNQLETVRSDEPIETDEVIVEVSFARDGTVELQVNEERVGSGQVGGAVETMPTDGLNVGKDEGGAVGEYSTPNPLHGSIRVVIELSDR